LTDYLIDEKVFIKDMAIVKELLEVFKWDVVAEYKEQLGPSAELLSACFRN